MKKFVVSSESSSLNEKGSFLTHLRCYTKVETSFQVSYFAPKAGLCLKKYIHRVDLNLYSVMVPGCCKAGRALLRS